MINVWLRMVLCDYVLGYAVTDIVDIKPKNMEELTEVITAADFHPSHCNIMMYSTSRGAIKLGDMRQAALCDSYCKGSSQNSQGVDNLAFS